ncbi:MAG: redoxin domain-containing protein [Firmicutes bacterium]|nr:redoxin domain-containing protein [Bacillota bacterium]
MNGIDIGVSASALTVFVQGLLSFFSPCVLPLIPLYMGYLAGGTIKVGPDGEKSYSQGKVALNTLFFVLGISGAFFVLGLGFSALGLFLRSHQLLLARIGGVIVILFGLYQLGIFGEIGLLSSEKKLPLTISRIGASPLSALVMGFVFSFAWTPCVGPVLSGVLLMATAASGSAASGSAASGSAVSSGAAGFLLIGVYTLGFVLPFLAAGLFTGGLLSFFKKHRNVVKYTTRIGGVLLILMGILMLSGRMNSLSSYLAGLSSPVEESEVTESLPTEEEKFAEASVIQEEISDEITESSVSAATESSEASESDSTEEKAFPAPDFILTDQYGTEHRLSDYRGKVIFLNFWATWCPPCRSEMPDIQKLYEEFTAAGREDVVFLGIAFPNMSGEQDIEGIIEFLEENGYTYPVLMDEEAGTAYSYYISAFPTTFMIDAGGNIFGYVTGALSEDFMRQIIDQTLE